jgi:hypothetical protein
MEIYCSQLGMLIPFSYCLRVQNNLPCASTYGCWKERVDVTAILRANFTDEELALAFNMIPRSRLQRMMESVSAARRNR